jgi:hypothetical protein
MEAFGPFPPKTPPEHPDDKLRSPRTDGRIAPQLAELVLALVHVLVLVLALVLTLVLASTSTSTSLALAILILPAVLVRTGPPPK